MSFTHLKVKSGYSMMESTLTIDEIVTQAKKLEFKSIALTDHHVLHGVIPFYKACVKQNIKPIIGMIVDIEDDVTEKEQCILIAKNNTGYQNLINISTQINTHQVNSIPKSDLKSYSKGLICILSIFDSQLSNAFHSRSHNEIHSFVKNWQAIFHTDDFYLGIQDHGIEAERKLLPLVKAYHEVYKTPVVAINDVKYLKEKDFSAYDCLQAIKHGEKWNGKLQNDFIYNRHIRSTIEMEQTFNSFWPEVIKETNTIAYKCNVMIDLNERKLPSYPLPDNKDAHFYLEELCWENIYQRYDIVSEKAKTRLTYELNVIKSMNFSDYFLIVWDFINFAKSKSILVGPGRGSSASSIVAYALGITDVDPLKYNLLFERFLNPERVTMPDIDVDFSDYRRDEVIQYVKNKYGSEHVAQIITFGTFAARSVVRELIKTMGIDQQDAHYILQSIPTQSSRTLVELINDMPSLKTYIKQSKQLELLFLIATKLEGLPRHSSTHAAGVVISEEPLVHHVPLISGSQKVYLTQYSMNELESIGLLKMDFLGLRNLTLLEKINQSIHKTENELINVNQLPDNDSNTFRLLTNGKTNGVFQLESAGMKRVLQQLKPSKFEDIVAVNALYRPGPMDFIPTYIARKNGKENITYPHEDLAPILKETNGVLIYQEQIMLIAHEIAGYSLGEADILRRAVSKKNTSLMNEQNERFVSGCMNQGYSKKVSEELFDWIVRFSNYGFPKSHAVAYSKISYQLAYLKANYPKNFFAELLSTVANQQEKVLQYSNEMKKFNISLLPPSINQSVGKYTITNDGVRMGFHSIKGIGNQVVKEIISTRKQGPYKNLFDFCLRVSTKVINRSSIEQLILVGAFDELFSNRASLLASTDTAINQGYLFKEFNDTPRLFEDTLELEADYVEMEDFNQVEKLTYEKEIVGVYLSNHPLNNYRELLRKNKYATLKHAKSLIGKRNVRSAVIIQSIKTIRTKRGDPMAFLTISDEETEMEAVVFPLAYRKSKSLLEENNLIFVTGSMETRNDKTQFLIDELVPFDADQLQSGLTDYLFINITDFPNEEALDYVKQTANRYPGNIEIIVHDKQSKETYKLSEGYSLHATKNCLQELHNVFGKENVILKNM